MKSLKKYTVNIYIVLLVILCIFMYCINTGNYPFIDTDETKFASIAKDMLTRSDWINVKLNGENVFNIPPFIFWIINLSCFIMGKITAQAVRLPISLITTAGVIILFLSVRNILTKTYALVISLIFATTLGILVFARLATNDMAFCIFTMSSILLANIILFTKKNKNLLWSGVFLTMGLAVMTGGLFGLLLPLVCISIIYLFSGSLKEMYNPRNILAAIVIIGFITVPWHLFMVYKNGLSFIKSYFEVYNISQNTDIKEILNVLLIFAAGFLPWIFSFLWIMGSRFKKNINSVISYFKENSQDKLKEKWKKLGRVEKFLSVNTIIFFTSLIFALIYGAKNTYLILFLTYPGSCIAGIYWYDYMIKKKHDKSIFISTLIPNIILIITSFTGVFGHNIINKMITEDFKYLMVPLITIFFVIPVYGIFSVILKGRKNTFISNILLMFFLTFIITPSFFNFMSLNGGENDLITFADKAKSENTELVAYIPSKKYSINYYYDKKVTYHKIGDTEWLRAYLKNNPKSYVIVEIKELWDIDEAKIPYMLIDSGRRYCIIQHLPYEIKKENNVEVRVY